MDNKQLTIYENQLNNSYISITPKDDAEAAKLFNIMTKCDGLVKDHINELFDLRHVILTQGEDEDGQSKLNIVMIDPNFKSYVTNSKVMANTLRRLFTIKGTPDTWKNSVKIKFTEVELKAGTGFSFELVTQPAQPAGQPAV